MKKQVFMPWWELHVPYLDKGRRKPQPPDELDKLWASMQQGQECPVITWTDGTVLSGARRWLAAKQANGKVTITTASSLYQFLDKLAAEREISQQYADVCKPLSYTETFWLMRGVHDWDDKIDGPSMRRSAGQLARSKNGEKKKRPVPYNDTVQRWAAAIGLPNWHTANLWQAGNRALDPARTETERQAAWKVLTTADETGTVAINREARIRAEVRRASRYTSMSAREVDALLANLGAVTVVLNGMDPDGDYSPLQRQRLLQQFAETRTRILYLTKHLRGGATA